MNQLFLDKLWNYKNFSMGIELDIAGEFIYDGIHTFNQMEVVDQDAMLFSFLYHISVGLERLQKIIVVLFEEHNIEDHKEFEESLITHSHVELSERICRISKLKLNTRENELLQLLTTFYKSARYHRFNLESLYGKEKRIITDFIIKNIPEDEIQYHFITNEILISDKVKELFGRVIGSISKKYYELVRKGCEKNRTFTYELRMGSKAEKIFLSNYKKNSLQKQKITERIVLKELLVYLRNSQDNNSFTRFIDSIQPINLDVALLNDYICEICEGIVPQTLIDEVEYLYEENEYSVKRMETVDAIGNTDIVFEMQDIHECFLMLDDLINSSHDCKKFAEKFLEKFEMIEDYELHEILKDVPQVCRNFLDGSITSDDLVYKMHLAHRTFKDFYGF